jgi:hypothetical protein
MDNSLIFCCKDAIQNTRQSIRQNMDFVVPQKGDRLYTVRRQVLSIKEPSWGYFNFD